MRTFSKMGDKGGVKNLKKIGDIIYGQPPKWNYIYVIFETVNCCSWDIYPLPTQQINSVT